MAPATFIGGPLDGAVISVNVDSPSYSHTRHTVYRYDWAGGNTFIFGTSTVITDDGKSPCS